jgi:hypothetical protein
MTGYDIEARLRSTLGELADGAPLVNPEQPRQDAGSPPQRPKSILTRRR